MEGREVLANTIHDESEVSCVVVNVVEQNAEVFSRFGCRVVPAAEWHQNGVGPLLIADHEGGDCVAARVLAAPVDLYSPKFGRRNLHAKHDTESRHYVGLGLKSKAGGADGEKVISVGGVLSGLEEVIMAPSTERVNDRGCERSEENIKEGVPVARGGDIPLTGAHDSVKTPKLRRRGMKGEGLGAPLVEGLAGQWGSDYCATVGVIGNEEVGDVRWDSEPFPGQAEERFGYTVKSALDVPG